MNSVRSLGWVLVVASWLVAASLFLLPAEPRTGVVAVLFPPWVSPATQLNSLIESDLYLVERRGRMILLAYAPANWTGEAHLRANGALSVFASDSFSLCTPPEAVKEGPITWDI